MTRFFLLIPCLLFAFITTYAQNDRNKLLLLSSQNGWEYELRGGFLIGGNTPLPIPKEIEKVKSYSPSLIGMFEGKVTKWLGKDRTWGVSLALKLEDKGMTTKAMTKNYSTKVISQGDYVAGYWTGGVKTKSNGTFLTIPVLVNLQLSDRWKLFAGPYLSYLLDGDFSGHVYEGYLRQGSPTGPKLEFKDGKIASYDFSSELSNLHYGLQIGGQWKAFNHFDLFGELLWGLNDIFVDDFETITFGMYPVYLTLGMAYNF